MNSQLENTNSKDYFALKSQFETFVLKISCVQKKLTQIWYDILLSYKFIAIIVVQIKTFKDINTQSEYSIITEKTKNLCIRKRKHSKTLH